MFSYKSRYCVAAAMAAMAALTGHVEARDIDLQSIGYFQFSPLPPTTPACLWLQTALLL